MSESRKVLDIKGIRDILRHRNDVVGCKVTTSMNSANVLDQVRTKVKVLLATITNTGISEPADGVLDSMDAKKVSMQGSFVAKNTITKMAGVLSHDWWFRR